MGKIHVAKVKLELCKDPAIPTVVDIKLAITRLQISEEDHRARMANIGKEIEKERRAVDPSRWQELYWKRSCIRREAMVCKIKWKELTRLVSVTDSDKNTAFLRK